MTEAMATSPEQMVVAFQHDYKIWNDESFQNRRPDDVNAMKTAEQNYAALLKKYTQPDFHGEPVAYGSDASHDPAREKIIGKNIQKHEAVITTQLSAEYYSPVYEYHFKQEKQKWYLTQIYLVDEDGKYPSL